MPAFAPQHVYSPHHFDIKRNRHGYWIARDRDGLVGGTFLTRKDALRFALFETDGDSAHVHTDPEPRAVRLDGPTGSPAYTGAVMNPRLPDTASRPKDATRRFSLSWDHCGTWKLAGSNSARARSFPDLAMALDFARVESDAEAATIEMFVDGFYICLHQPKGWPHRLPGQRDGKHWGVGGRVRAWNNASDAACGGLRGVDAPDTSG